MRVFDRSYNREITVQIPKGIREENEILHERTVFRIKTLQHKTFTRRGDDLEFFTRISPFVTGAICIRTIDNKEITLRKPAMFPLKTTFPGRGLPNYENPNLHGNLNVHIESLKSGPYVTKF